MAEESKQLTAFTLGSMRLFECDKMPFGLCNVPATFQRLMQNCLYFFSYENSLKVPFYQCRAGGFERSKKTKIGWQ